MLGILFSSMRSLKAFSWLLQYSPYTEKLSLCKIKGKTNGQDHGIDTILYWLVGSLEEPTEMIDRRKIDSAEQKMEEKGSSYCSLMGGSCTVARKVHNWTAVITYY